jgi:predicted nuclease of predicted toxin-antitoxin system
VNIKLDENLPLALVPPLQGLGHDVDTVPQEQLSGRPDPDIWSAAQAARRLLVTQDLDFSDIRQFAPGTHHGLVLVRLDAPGRLALIERIVEAFRYEDVAAWERAFVVVTDRKVRVRKA